MFIYLHVHVCWEYPSFWTSTLHCKIQVCTNVLTFCIFKPVWHCIKILPICWTVEICNNGNNVIMVVIVQCTCINMSSKMIYTEVWHIHVLTQYMCVMFSSQCVNVCVYCTCLCIQQFMVISAFFLIHISIFYMDMEKVLLTSSCLLNMYICPDFNIKWLTTKIWTWIRQLFLRNLNN